VLGFGLVGQTMHQVDEYAPIADLVTLTAVYGRIIEKYFDNYKSLDRRRGSRVCGFSYRRDYFGFAPLYASELPH
jgi:hypothetical protein